jgi:hypothetical protein
MEKMLEKEVQELDNHPPLAAGERKGNKKRKKDLEVRSELLGM